MGGVVKESIFGVPLKWITLVTLTLQNSALMLVVHHSRTIPGPQYLPSTAVVLSELIKLLISLCIHISSLHNSHTLTAGNVFEDVFGVDSDFIKMMVPGVLYLIQNNLQYVALTKLDAATVQVTYQMKILTTAVCSVLMLGRRLSGVKWMALGLLTVGIAVVQLPDNARVNVGGIGGHGGRGYLDSIVGFVAVLMASLLSGLAGVYFEKVLKGSLASVWVRNVQLGVFGLVVGLVGVYVFDNKIIVDNGFFHGYNFWTWAAITCQALGGILVALVVKYADNILKGFATSISILLSSTVSFIFFDLKLSVFFLSGSALVLYATHLYSEEDLPHEKVLKRLPEKTEFRSDLVYVKVEPREVPTKQFGNVKLGR